MTEKRFEFHFAGSDRIELVETCFTINNVSTPRRTVRGKTAGALINAGTFQWTSSVRALSMLFLKGALSKLDPNEDPLLSGTQGSLAASLDYAMSKQPSWILDMFGFDADGKCIARRLINRSNTERKRPGPVTLALKPLVIRESEIQIYWESKLITSAHELAYILAQIEPTAEMSTLGDEIGALAA